jgi:hypothetical protein
MPKIDRREFDLDEKEPTHFFCIWYRKDDAERVLFLCRADCRLPGLETESVGRIITGFLINQLSVRVGFYSWLTAGPQASEFWRAAVIRMRQEINTRLGISLD